MLNGKVSGDTPETAKNPDIDEMVILYCVQLFFYEFQRLYYARVVCMFDVVNTF